MALGASGLRRSWGVPRVDLRLLVGVLLVAVAMTGGLRYANSLSITEPVVVAARTIPAGQVITPSDLSISEARLEGALRALAVSENDLTTIVGRTAGQTIHAGALVLPPDLTTAPGLGADEVAVTVPVATDGVFGGLWRGDDVAVVATSEPGRVSSETSVLLERATVFAVARESARVSLNDSGAAEGRITNVTVVVPRSEVERVTHALVNGRVTLVLAPPSAEATP